MTLKPSLPGERRNLQERKLVMGKRRMRVWPMATGRAPRRSGWRCTEPLVQTAGTLRPGALGGTVVRGLVGWGELTWQG